jgi:hypothetical protein
LKPYKKRKDSQVDNGDISVISCRHCNSIYDSIYYINVLLDSWFLITLFKQFKRQNLAIDKNKIGMKNKHWNNVSIGIQDIPQI